MPTNKAAIFGLVATLVGTGIGTVAGFNQLMNPANSVSQDWPVASLPTAAPSPSVAPSPVGSGWLSDPVQSRPTQSSVEPSVATPDRTSSDQTAATSTASQLPDQSTTDAPTGGYDQAHGSGGSQPPTDRPTQTRPTRDRRWPASRSEQSWQGDRIRHLSSLPEPSQDGRYHCADITKAEAQALLQQGETYLDPDGDGQACERGTKGYPSQPDRPNVEPEPRRWRSRQVSSQPEQTWRDRSQPPHPAWQR